MKSLKSAPNSDVSVTRARAEVDATAVTRSRAKSEAKIVGQFVLTPEAMRRKSMKTRNAEGSSKSLNDTSTDEIPPVVDPKPKKTVRRVKQEVVDQFVVTAEETSSTSSSSTRSTRSKTLASTILPENVQKKCDAPAKRQKKIKYCFLRTILAREFHNFDLMNKFVMSINSLSEALIT